jgi:hypothetical protein
MISWISAVFVAISSFAFRILLIWVFFSPHFSQVCPGSANLIYFFKEPTFFFIDSLYFFFVSISLISALILIISFLLLILGFACSYFSRSLAVVLGH